MSEQENIGLIGTVTYDVITSDAGEVYRGLGGILYQAAVLCALGKNVLLFTNLGRELSRRVMRVTHNWQTLKRKGVQQVPGPGNRVHLHYPKKGERREILESVVPPINPLGILPFLGRLHMLVLVLNSGFDIALSDWRRIANASGCPIWLDIHSLVLSRELKTPRTFLSNIPWKNWARGVTYLQVNQTELGCLLGCVGQRLSEKEIGFFGQSAFDMGIRAVFVTLGRNGVLVLTPAGSRILVPSHAGTVEDTTGCGDVFCAVSVKKLAEGVDLFSAAQAGVELATQATAAKGIKETFELACLTDRRIEYP